LRYVIKFLRAFGIEKNKYLMISKINEGINMLELIMSTLRAISQKVNRRSI